MKLIACYSVFDGLELLEPAIRAIAKYIDGVVICWQNTSNNGHQISQKDFDIVVGFGKYAHIELKAFMPDPKLDAKKNEIAKHNMMVEKAREMGATHFIMGATDHFFDPVEFQFAKRLVGAMDYDATFTGMYTYYKHPTWQITPVEDYYMPFICKLYPETRIEWVPRFPLRVDPSVKMNTWHKWYLFKDFEIMMHHYSLVRQDIRGKFTNAASPWRKEQIDEFTRDWDGYDLETNPGIKYFQGRKVKVVRDYFDLSPIFEGV